ncbi:hypothetical protein HMPREF0670_02134 [Prevotella sp. oral taxon 317 str. F0108]|nr:hypothetical protein HMPREF0670_02134 [Prevotella sp. oral taxon 317 str. F0108]
MRKRTRGNSLYYVDEWGGCYAGALSTNRFIIPSIGSLALFASFPVYLSFVCGHLVCPVLSM